MIINEINSYINDLYIKEKKSIDKNNNIKVEKKLEESSIDCKKIEKIKSLIDSGNYVINSLEVAKKILGY